MATEIYTEESGAQSAKIFGCTVKSVNAQMGFDDQPTIVTVTVIKDTKQRFTLDQNDVQSIQPIEFGSLNILGIVQSWDNVVTDVGGTGIYTIKLTDCRTVLDSAVIITNPATHWQENDFGVDQLPSSGEDTIIDYGENVIPIQIPTEHDFDFGLPFSGVKDSLHGAILYYGNDVFEIDVDALEILPYDDTGRGAPVRVDGPVKTVSEVISEICKQFGYQWWVECYRKSAKDSTIVIEVNIISRLGEANNSIVFDMDSLAALHPNKVSSRKDGHENKNEITKTVLQGGIRRQLLEVNAIHIGPFWGWNEAGTEPIGNPAYQDPTRSTYQLKGTSILQMKQALNGDLDDIWIGRRELDLIALKGYANKHWGKMFGLRLHRKYLDKDGKSWVKSMPAGWWEQNVPEQPEGLDGIALHILCSDDGRWKPFLRFRSRKWDSSVNASNNAITHKGGIQILCSLKQTGVYVIMDLSVATKFITSLAGDSKRIDCDIGALKAYIPFMDPREFYGPWSSDVQTPSRFQKRGKTTIEIDSDLVPWKHGYRGMSNVQGMEELNWIADGRIHARTTERQIINTGQLEVTDVPRVNIGRAIDGGSNITNISTQFSNTGITTRYTMNLYTDELGNLRQIERKRADEFYRLLRKMQAKIGYKKDATVNDELKTLFDKHGPTPEEPDFTLEGIEGGMGVITTVGPGPYYAVRRLSYQDINPGGYAGTTVLADSYFMSEWKGVRNLSEDINSPGMLPVGTRVTVSIFSESDEHGPYIPYIEQAPQFFAPPPLEE